MKNIIIIIFIFLISSSFNSFSNDKKETLKKINEKCNIGFKDSGMDTNSITLLCNCLIENYALNFPDSILLSMASDDEEKADSPDPHVMEKVQKIMNSCMEKIQN